MRKIISFVIVLTIAFSVILASPVYVGLGAVAQKNQTKASSNSNQTTVTPVGKQSTRIINQTSIPANKTSTTIEKKTEPIGKVPLPSNQTKLSPTGSVAKLPPVSNKTTVTPAGKATTTVINKTSTPINVSSTTSDITAKQPPKPTPAANQTTAKQPPPTNNTATNSGNPLAKIPIIGKLFGGK